MTTIQTQRCLIRCVSMGIWRIMALTTTVLLGFFVAAILAWLIMLGEPIGISGWILLFVYGSVTIGLIASAILIILEWFQIGRQKRAASVDEFELDV